MEEANYETARLFVAAYIKRRRSELGLSQEGLALDANIDRTFVSQIERGVGNPSLRTLCKLADRLGFPATVLDALMAEIDRDALGDLPPGNPSDKPDIDGRRRRKPGPA